MSRVIVRSAAGVVLVDLEDETLIELDDATVERETVEVGLPLVVAADTHGSRVVAVVSRRPPLMLSDDAGTTWREAGAGLPSGVDVAISPEHPDRLLYASGNRLFVSEDGGRFWRSLALELQDIEAVAWDV